MKPYTQHQGPTMNTSLLFFIITAAYLSSVTLQAHAQTHDHEAASAHAHEEHASTELSLNNGKQWETDAALRHGMVEIRTAVDMLAPAFEAGQLDQSQARQLSQAVQGSVNTMIAQCELEPAADANLHSILAMLLAGAASIEASPMSSDGLPALKDALQTYGHYFNHAGWQGDDHAAHAH